MSRTALITGISGQDGAYLARFLVEKGYRVVGGLRRAAGDRMARLAELGIEREVEIVELDLLELTNIMRQLERVKPDEIYNLAGQTHVGLSFEQPIYTAEVDAIGPARLLEAIRVVVPQARFYQASTSEMFGKMPNRSSAANERHPFHPRSPYGISKLFAHWMTVSYRDSYGLYAVSGILFNHESPLRGREFVTRRITHGLASIRNGGAGTLALGNLESCRDWGFAGDYVAGMWQMLQQPEPADLVLATGRSESVRSFAELAASQLGYDLVWQRDGQDEVGLDRRSSRVLITVDNALRRPAEVDWLLGDASEAKLRLGWSSTTSLESLVGMMIEADMRRYRDGAPAF
ncbi:MAG: GDP-mannose 4,6-dehydratase [Bauldia sp.]